MKRILIRWTVEMLTDSGCGTNTAARWKSQMTGRLVTQRVAAVDEPEEVASTLVEVVAAAQCLLLHLSLLLFQLEAALELLKAAQPLHHLDREFSLLNRGLD